MLALPARAPRPEPIDPAGPFDVTSGRPTRHAVSMTSRAALLRASLLAAATPLVACGGDTSGSTASTGAQGGASGSSSGGAGGGAQGGGGGAVAQTKYPCKNPVAITVDGKDTGYDTCDAGQTRRREAKTCPSLLPRAAACDPSGGAQSCTLDSECKDKPNGYCASSSGFAGPGCACAYGCTSDAECGADAICVCGDPIGHCAPSTCKDDASCPAGDCASYDSHPGCSFTAFACQSAADTCGGDKDCGGAGATLCGYPTGAAGGPSAKSCQSAGCAIGRPLLIEDAVRAARLTSRADWA